jgi:hypothetical protein
MNMEIVRRLSESFRELDKTKLIANALLNDLPGAVVDEMVDKVIRDRMTDEEADRLWEEERVRAEEAGDLWAEQLVDLRREGGQFEEDSK